MHRGFKHSQAKGQKLTNIKSIKKLFFVTKSHWSITILLNFKVAHQGFKQAMAKGEKLTNIIDNKVNDH